MTQLRFWGSLAGGLALSLGCGGSTVDPVSGGPGGADAGGAQGTNAGAANSNPSGGADANGSDGADSTPAGGAGPNGGGFCAPGTCAGAANSNGSGGADALPSGGAPPALAALAGTWTGYVENYHFADMSDAIKLVLDGKGAGHLTVGDSPAPAPAKDFDVGYAPALTPQDAPGSIPPFLIFVGLRPGFSFTLRSVSLVGSRIQFDVSGSELSALWCQHQTPFNAYQGHYACAPTGYSAAQDGTCSAIDPTTMKDVPMDCSKLLLCAGGINNMGLSTPSPCACTAKACAADPSVDLVHFDLRLDLANAAGSAAGLDASVHNAYLTQVSR